MKPLVIGKIVVVFSLIAMIAGCAGGNAAATSEEKTTDVASTSRESSVVDNADDSTVSVPKEKADILEKYPELISYLKSEDYQSAETYVHELVLQQKKEAAGDIEDYLVTVDLNSENFEDYFEFKTVPMVNAFGETKSGEWYGLKSKKYDEGLIVYSLDPISVECILNSETSVDRLDDLLLFCVGYERDDGAEEAPSFSGRITEGKVTYIKQEYIEDYTIPEQKTYDFANVDAEIRLKNGDTIKRNVNPAYPY